MSQQTRREADGDDTRAALGDLLVVKGWLQGEGELRIYRNEHELALRCPGSQTCRQTTEKGRRTLHGGLPLVAPGNYRVVLLKSGSSKLPDPSGDERKDLQAASKAGANPVDTFFVNVF